MTTLAFTASRDGFSPLVSLPVFEVVARLPAVTRYVTGGCRGGDAWLGSWLHAQFPDAAHVVIVPANRSQVDPWWTARSGLPVSGAPVRVLEMPPGTSYAARNAELVRRGDEVIGFPAWPEDDPRSRRSGTWQALRQARVTGKPVRWQCVMSEMAGVT